MERVDTYGNTGFTRITCALLLIFSSRQTALSYFKKWRFPIRSSSRPQFSYSGQIPDLARKKMLFEREVPF
jgi:hypothetical protein